MTPETKGFTSCGQYYTMSQETPLIEQLSILAKEIRQNAINAKYAK